MKKLLSLLLAVLLALSLFACNGQNAASSPSPAPESPSASAAPPSPSAVNTSETVKFTDSAGREVEVPAKITRIVASGSLAQIVLFSLAPDMLIGLAGKWSESAEHYVDAKYYNLPVLGQFYGSDDLNLEEIAKVAP